MKNEQFKNGAFLFVFSIYDRIGKSKPKSHGVEVQYIIQLNFHLTYTD